MPKIIFNKKKACSDSCNNDCSHGNGPITKDVTLCPKIRFVLEKLKSEEAKQQYIKDVEEMIKKIQNR